MFKSLERIYSKLKSFINYISCKLLLNSEKPYYEQLPEDDIRNIL